MESKGHVTFTVTYDDTGAVTKVDAAEGWTIREVVAKAYDQLKETARQGDKVEFDGKPLEPFYDLHVKQFVEKGIDPDRQLNIVSRIGGAVE